LVPSYIAPSLLFSKLTRTARTYPATWKMLRCRWCQIQITHVCYYICFLTLASKWHAFQKSIYIIPARLRCDQREHQQCICRTSNEYSVFASVLNIYVLRETIDIICRLFFIFLLRTLINYLRLPETKKISGSSSGVRIKICIWRNYYYLLYSNQSYLINHDDSRGVRRPAGMTAAMHGSSNWWLRHWSGLSWFIR